MTKKDSQRELLRKASDALGIASCNDLADYYRMSPRDAKPRIDELVEGGALIPVQVEDWKEQAYLAISARSPRSIPGSSLLSPFDPMVWFRPRAKRLFGFDYRIEIYVPAPKRQWGYYVLPFRQGDEITARVDLKANRKESTLLVCNAHSEERADENVTAAALSDELRLLAAWTGLSNICVEKARPFESLLANSLGLT